MDSMIQFFIYDFILYLFSETLYLDLMANLNSMAGNGLEDNKKKRIGWSSIS